jgi:MFS family permease
MRAAHMASPPTLWRHRDFLLLWVGQSVSRLGDQFTGLAIPVIAVFILGAGPFEMGLLGFAGTLPFLLFGLLVGVWVDRRQRRSILILADLGRGAMIASIAILGLAGLLHMAYLYVLSFLIGILTVFFDVAYQAYLPALVDRNRLVDANSKLETSNSLAGTGGPALAGAVIEWFKAPVAMVFDAASFFVSALTLGLIRKREPTPDPKERRSILVEIREGLQVVLKEPRLRHIAACTAWSNFFSSAVFSALLILYLKDALGFTPISLGLLFTVGSVGGIIGALTSNRIAKRIGVGPSIIWGAVLFSIPTLPLPFVTGILAFPAIAAMFFVSIVGNLLYNINQVSFRQAIVPVRLQGRLNATMRTIVWGTLPLGAIAGGVLGDTIGLRPAIILGLAGGALSFLWVLFSPVRAIREMPESAA